jgi:hypothetical protein
MKKVKNDVDKHKPDPMVLARTIGRLETSIPSSATLYFEERDAIKMSRDIGLIGSCEERGVPCVFVCENFHLDYEADKLPSDADLSEICGPGSFVILPNNREEFLELNEEARLFVSGFSSLFEDESIPIKWVQFAELYSLVEPRRDAVFRKRLFIAGLDRVILDALGEIVFEAKSASKKYRHMGSSPYDPYIGQHYIDLGKYKKHITSGFGRFKSKHRKIIRRFKLGHFISEFEKKAKQFKGKVENVVDPGARPGRNHHTGLPYY